MFFHQHETVADAAVKSSPVAVASGLHFMHITLPDLIQYLTLVYTLLLISEKVYVLYKKYRGRRKNESKK